MGEFSLDLNEDQLQLQKWVHDFAEGTMRPAAHEWDEREETPWPIIEEAANIGLYSFEFLTNGFSDPTGLSLPLIYEELSWGDAGIALALMGSSLAVAGIAANGTPEQLFEWAPQCFGTPGDLKLGAFCVSEADAGSDVSSLRTHAVYDEKADEWVLNGTKTWITNGGIAHTNVVVASVDPTLGSRGQASFVVPEGTPGISAGQKFQKMGIRASHTGEVILDDCRIPGRCLLGGKEKLDERLARVREGKRSSSQAAMATFESTRPAVGAQAVGIARAALEYSLAYTMERKAFGRRIIENQGIAFKLSDMKTRIDASRLLVQHASWMGATGKHFTSGEGSMSKLFAGETAVWVTEQAIQIMGGYGYVREHPVERWHRDSKIYTIFEGTSEIQRLVIARRDLRNPHPVSLRGDFGPEPQRFHPHFHLLVSRSDADGGVMLFVRRSRSDQSALVLAFAAAAAMGLTAAFTLGGFSASIANSTSTFSSATIQLEESNGTTTCYSTGSGAGGSVTASNNNSTCTINALIGTPDQVPSGTALAKTFTFTNVGNRAATVAQMATGACTQSAASDDSGYIGGDTAFCSKVDVTIANLTSGATDKCVYPTQAAACPSISNSNTLTGLAGQTFNTVPMSALASGGSATYLVTVQLDTSATNADQGLTATVPFTWSISQ